MFNLTNVIHTIKGQVLLDLSLLSFLLRVLEMEGFYSNQLKIEKS